MLDKNNNPVTSNHSNDQAKAAGAALVWQYDASLPPPLPREIYLGKKRTEQPPVAADDLRQAKRAKL